MLGTMMEESVTALAGPRASTTPTGPRCATATSRARLRLGDGGCLGIDIDGTKHPLALVEGATENATLARELLVGLRERGLDVTRPIPVVIDGAKAERRR